MTRDKTIIWFIGLLVLATLACNQAGQILSPEDATATAVFLAIPEEVEETESTETIETDRAMGEEITLVTAGAVVPLATSPGSGSISFAANLQPATIIDIREVDGVIWYKVNSTSGEGWITENYIQPSVVESEDGEISDELNAEIGETVYLVGTGFMVTLVDQAGGNRMIATEPRGGAVEIVDKKVVAGVAWYKVDGTSQPGWVTSESLSREAP